MLSNLDTAWRYPLALLLGLLTGLYIGGMLATIYVITAFRESIGRTANDMASRNIAVDADTLSAGVEALGPSAARVAVVMRSVQTVANQQVKQSVVPVRVTLTKRDNQWLVLEMSPIHAR